MDNQIFKICKTYKFGHIHENTIGFVEAADKNDAHQKFLKHHPEFENRTDDFEIRISDEYRRMCYIESLLNEINRLHDMIEDSLLK